MSCPASIIYHIGGGTLAKNNPKKIYLNFRNNLIMLWKNLEGMDAFITVGFRFLLDAIKCLEKPAFRTILFFYCRHEGPFWLFQLASNRAEK